MSTANKDSGYAYPQTTSNNHPEGQSRPVKRPPKKVKKKPRGFWEDPEHYILKAVMVTTTLIVGVAFIIFAVIHAYKFLVAAMH